MKSRQEVMERVAEANAQFYGAIENGDIDLMRRVWAEEDEAPEDEAPAPEVAGAPAPPPGPVAPGEATSAMTQP